MWESIKNFFGWFSGNDTTGHHGPGYMRAIDCMNQDWLWIYAALFENAFVSVCYLLIAIFLHRTAKDLRNQRNKEAVLFLRNIFLFCALCGYMFYIIKMFWPAWRLYVITLAFLSYNSLGYVRSLKNLKLTFESRDTMEIEIKQAHADLSTARDLAHRKSIYINSLSHDIRSPLNNINLQNQLALMYAEKLPDSPEKASLLKALGSTKGSVTAASTLLTTFLEFAKHDVNPEDTHITSFLFSDLCEELKSSVTVPEGITLNISGCQQVKVNTDRIKLRRILINLLENSLKFTKAGTVSLSATIEGDELVVLVEDTGCGMNKEDISKIFDAFYQVGNPERSNVKGFGLGLAIVKRLVENIGGSITVESVEGVGSKFVVSVPGVLTPKDSDGSKHEVGVGG